MNRKRILVVCVIAILVSAGALAFAYFYPEVAPEPSYSEVASDLPLSETKETPQLYAYSCDRDIYFVMSPSKNAETLELLITNGKLRSFPNRTTVTRIPNIDAAFYQSADVLLQGVGERVTLTSNEDNVFCEPIPNSALAPWNFGDELEGGALMWPDERKNFDDKNEGRTASQVAAIDAASKSIVGVWKPDPYEEWKYYLEFKADGSVVETFDGVQKVEDSMDIRWHIETQKEASRGWESPLAGDFVQFYGDGSLYLLKLWCGDGCDGSFFKIVTLTSDRLETIIRWNTGSYATENYTRVR